MKELLGSFSLPHSNIVNQHLLRKYGCSIGITGPVSAHGNVQHKEKRAPENPIRPRRKRSRSHGLIRNSIDKKLYPVWGPVDREPMKGLVEKISMGQFILGCNAGFGIVGPMERTVGEPGLAPQVLHDVQSRHRPAILQSRCQRRASKKPATSLAHAEV